MDARQLKDKASQAFAKGKWGKAAEHYEEYCQADPRDTQSRLRLGDAWAKAGNTGKAVHAYQWAAEGFAKEGFLPRAIAAAKLVLELDPSHKGVQQMLADLYARKSLPASGRGKIGTQPGGRAVALETPPKPAAKGAVKNPAMAISPLNRADAIEVPEFEVPEGAAAPTIGGMSADRGPSPLTAKNAIAIEVDAGPAERAALQETEIDLEVSTSSGKGEVEVPIEGEVVAQAPKAAPPPPGPADAVGEAEVVEEKPAPPPKPKVYDLEVLDDAEAVPIEALQPKRKAPVSYELDVPVPLDEPLTPAPKKPAPQILADEPAKPEVEIEVGPADEAPEPAEVEVEVGPAAPPPPPASEAGPPGLRPRKAAEGDGGRIWVPPTFAAQSRGEEPPAARAAPAVPLTPQQTELERSLEIFAEFDIESPLQPVIAAPPPRPRDVVVAAPPPPAPAPAHEHFTELELEGETLFHEVEAAAARSSGEELTQALEEAMEAPEEGKPEPGALPRIPLFSDLPQDAFIALFEQCPLRRFEPGQLVIQQGSKGDSFFVICAGTANVFRMEGDARRELATLQEGAFFGEMALLSDSPRTASVEATAEDTQLLEISADTLKQLSAKHPTVAAALKKFYRQRLLANLMGSAPLFKPFSKGDRRALVEKFKAREVRRGEVLIAEGKASDGLYVVLAGEVEVKVRGQRVATLKEGEVFGEMSLLTRKPGSATVAASKRTSLLRLPREAFDAIIMSHPQILELVAELSDARTRQNAALQQKTNATESMV